MQIGLYRKAFAVLLTGFLGVAALFVPGIDAYVGPEVIAVASTFAAAIAAFAVANKMDGFNVNDLAAALLEAAEELEAAEAEADAKTATNVAYIVRGQPDD